MSDLSQQCEQIRTEHSKVDMARVERFAKPGNAASMSIPARYLKSIDTLLAYISELQSELAGYDVCLTQVREEMSELGEAMSAGQYITQHMEPPPTYFESKPAEAARHRRNLTRAVDLLQRSEAANRNAIAIHMASIERLKSDNARLTAANAEYTKRHAEQALAAADRQSVIMSRGSDKSLAQQCIEDELKPKEQQRWP